jgi:predicted Zn-dependent peptidase
MAASLIGTGTTSRTKDQINEEIDFIGGTLSSSSSGIYASSLTKHINRLLEVMSDVTIHSVFKTEEVEKIRTQFLSGLAAEKDDPESIAANVSAALWFGKDHPYGEFETESSITRITPEMCTSYYNTYFKPNIAYLSIVGDITPGEAKKLVAENLQDLYSHLKCASKYVETYKDAAQHLEEIFSKIIPAARARRSRLHNEKTQKTKQIEKNVSENSSEIK